MHSFVMRCRLSTTGVSIKSNKLLCIKMRILFSTDTSARSFKKRNFKRVASFYSGISSQSASKHVSRLSLQLNSDPCLFFFFSFKSFKYIFTGLAYSKWTWRCCRCSSNVHAFDTFCFCFTISSRTPANHRGAHQSWSTPVWSDRKPVRVYRP